MKGKPPQPDAVKNLTGVLCPMNLVYAKVELAKLQEDQLLELIVDEGPPAINIEKSLAREGHSLLAKVKLAGNCWSLLIRKSGAGASSG